MKKTFFKSLVATAVATTAVMLSTVMAFAATYTLTADADGVVDGDTFADGYFTAVGAGAYKSSAGINTFELGKRGSNYIKFTPEGNATITVSFASTGGSNTSTIDLCDDTGASLEQASVTGTTPIEYTFTVKGEIGTTYRIANTGTARATRLASVTVVEEGAASYPDFADADTDTILDAGKATAAKMDANVTGLAAGDTAGSVEAPYDTTTMPGFTVYGNVSTDETTGTQTFKGMTVEANSKSFEGVTYANRLKTNGVGNTSRYCIKFDVDSDSTIEVIGMSGNSSSTRPVVLATDGDKELAKHYFVGSTMSKAEFSVTAGTYYLYAGDATVGSNGGINLYSVKVYDGITYKLPVVTLSNDGMTADSSALQLTASLNSDYTSGEITGIGFILAKPDATATTKCPCTYYKIEGNNIVFIANVTSADYNLKAQAYVEYTSAIDGTTVTRYSNTTVNVVE